MTETQPTSTNVLDYEAPKPVAPSLLSQLAGMALGIAGYFLLVLVCMSVCSRFFPTVDEYSNLVVWATAITLVFPLTVVAVVAYHFKSQIMFVSAVAFCLLSIIPVGWLFSMINYSPLRHLYK